VLSPLVETPYVSTPNKRPTTRKQRPEHHLHSISGQIGKQPTTVISTQVLPAGFALADGSGGVVLSPLVETPYVSTPNKRPTTRKQRPEHHLHTISRPIGKQTTTVISTQVLSARFALADGSGGLVLSPHIASVSTRNKRPTTRKQRPEHHLHSISGQIGKQTTTVISTQVLPARFPWIRWHCRCSCSPQSRRHPSRPATNAKSDATRKQRPEHTTTTESPDRLENNRRR
jgi:hypothetical protein